MGKPKTWVHRILGLMVLAGFYSAVCVGLGWGLYAPLTDVFSWVVLNAAWAAFLYAGHAVTTRALAAITKGESLWGLVD